MSTVGAWLAGSGRWLPDDVLTNAELGAAAGVDEQWIVQRTGIRERRVANDDTGTAHMAARAGRAALDDADFDAARLELIIVATSTPDHLTPPTACEVQATLQAPNAACFDIEGGFAGWIYALITADGLIRAATVRNALVIGADKLSTVTDRSDPNTGPLFGDGAGALLLSADAEAGDVGVRTTSWWADGTLADALSRPGGGARRPFDATVLEQRSHLLRMEGTRLFRPAVRVMAEQGRRALARAGLTPDDVGLVVPHQANLRIISALGAELGIEDARVFVNIERYGNTGAATVPIALDEARESGRTDGDRPMLLVSFGAGATAGAAVLARATE